MIHRVVNYFLKPRETYMLEQWVLMFLAMLCGWLLSGDDRDNADETQYP